MNRVVQQCIATGSDTVVVVGKDKCPMCDQVERKILKDSRMKIEKYNIQYLEPEELQEFIDCFGQSLPMIPETVEGVKKVRSLWNRGFDGLMDGAEMMPVEGESDKD